MYFSNISNKTVLVNQPAGIGDIIFSMKIASAFIENNNVVTWPVDYNFCNIQKNFPYINFISTKDFPEFFAYKNKMVVSEDEKFFYLPLQYAHKIVNAGCMRAKYLLMGMDFTEWKDINILRDFDKENELFKLLKLDENEEYTLINHNWDSRVLKREFKLLESDNNRKVEMSIIDGYNLLDWMKVIQYADRIHTVSTSLIYLLELFDLKASKIFLYERVNGSGMSDIEFFLTKKYIY